MAASPHNNFRSRVQVQAIEHCSGMVMLHQLLRGLQPTTGLTAACYQSINSAPFPQSFDLKTADPATMAFAPSAMTCIASTYSAGLKNKDWQRLHCTPAAPSALIMGLEVMPTKPAIQPATASKRTRAGYQGVLSSHQSAATSWVVVRRMCWHW